MGSLNNVVFMLTVCILFENLAKILAFRVFDVNGVQTILALEDEDISIVCKTGMPMAYCGFIHPTGKRFSFSGLSLINGQCAVKIKATKNDSGDWRCHIGKRTIGVEIKQDIQLRVVNQVAAVEPNIIAVHGKEVTLTCVTTREKLPLRYCRFEPPNGSPFSIDPDVKPTKPILGKYYYPQNKSLDRGDCAVTIHKVKYSDVGAWTCGAGLDDGKEHTDVIRLEVEGLYTMSTASTTGITFGTLGIIAFLAILAVVVWKKRRLMGTAGREPEVIEVQDLPRSETPVSRELPRAETPISREFPRAETPGPQISPREARRGLPTLVVQSPSTPGSTSIM